MAIARKLSYTVAGKVMGQIRKSLKWGAGKLLCVKVLKISPPEMPFNQ